MDCVVCPSMPSSFQLSLASEKHGRLGQKIIWGGEVVGIVGYTSKETPFLSNPGIFYFYSTHCLKIDAPNQSSVLFLWTVGKSKNHTWYWANSVLRIMLLNQAGGFHIVLSYLLQTFALLLSELLC